MRTVETPSAAGTGWRRALSQLYRMIEAAQTSPLESLYERVLRLEQEVSALKRNLPMGSVDHDWRQP
jgi:polyhydroxyalkanoate synthesis regulator phasin